MSNEQLTALLPSAAIFIAAIAALITAVAYGRRKEADTVSELVESLTRQLTHVTHQLDTANAKIDVIRNELGQQRSESKGYADGLLLRIGNMLGSLEHIKSFGDGAEDAATLATEQDAAAAANQQPK